MKNEPDLDKIRSNFSTYASGRSTVMIDNIEVLYKKIRDKIFGFDLSVFDDPIQFCYEAFGMKISREEALEIAKNKQAHKKLWFEKKRTEFDDYINFYSESLFYIFRQPFLARYGGYTGGYRWFLQLVDHFNNPQVLEYGCGSAVLTESLLTNYPEANYSVADIPSVTLDFIRWKKEKYYYPYRILEIGGGRKGIPLERNYDLLICRDVLEHTPNPYEIVDEMINHSSPGAVLCIDFLPGGREVYKGENLSQALKQREDVKRLLKNRTIRLKPIGDEMGDHDGLYVNPWK